MKFQEILCIITRNKVCSKSFLYTGVEKTTCIFLRGNSSLRQIAFNVNLIPQMYVEQCFSETFELDEECYISFTLFLDLVKKKDFEQSFETKFCNNKV